MANALVPDAATGADTMQQPMGPWEAQFARYLQPDPAWTYGSVLPLAQNNATGAIRPAIPSMVRDFGQGVLQLLDGPATGTVTPQASNALVAMVIPSLASDGDALLSAGATGKGAMAKAPVTWYHGTTAPFEGAPSLDKFGTGAFMERDLAASGFKPAVYMTDDLSHAQQYGDHIISGGIPEDQMHPVDAVGPLTSWAKELGYGRDAQKMIDDYFDGSLYQALDADSFFNDAAAKAANAGKKAAVVNFGKLKGRDNGRTYGGKVAIVLDPSIITNSAPLKP